MTREQIDIALDRAAKQLRERSTDGAVAILLDVIDGLHMRLIAVEPCPGAPKTYNDKGHVWDGGTCSRCQARRTQ